VRARPDRSGVRAGRPPWSAPNGRDLLAGIAVLSVLVAVLVVMARDGGRRVPASEAEPLRRAGAAAASAAAVPEWSDVPIAATAAELGPSLSRAVADGLAEARTRIGRCVALERRRAPSTARPDGAGPLELVLRLSPRSGGVHVVGIEATDTAGAAMLAQCAHRHLDGDVFPAEGVVPGRRHRLLVALP
jgi:hypothetical protein